VPQDALYKSTSFYLTLLFLQFLTDANCAAIAQKPMRMMTESLTVGSSGTK